MPSITNLDEAQAALRPYYDNARTPYTLDAMRVLMDFLHNPQNKLRVIHVAGTSGKSSTAYYAAALLAASGKQVGLSVSPHVDTVNERLQINGSPLSEKEFCAVLNEFLGLISDCPVKPSYFELLVAMAYWYFDRRKLDYVVMEVGLGGLLDGTNVIDRPDKVCIITDIGLDHTEILGDSITKITAQKAGIIQSGNQVYMHRQVEDVMSVVRDVCLAKAASLHTVSNATTDIDKSLPLFQQRNLHLAIEAVRATLARDYKEAPSEISINQAAKTTVPARLERFSIKGKTIIIDGSHNQQKLHTMLTSIKSLFPNEPMAILCSFVSGDNKRWHAALIELASVTDNLIFTPFASEQDLPKSSITIDEFEQFCQTQGIKHYHCKAQPAAAYRQLLESPESLLVVTGSFYLLNHIRPLVKERSQ